MLSRCCHCRTEIESVFFFFTKQNNFIHVGLICAQIRGWKVKLHELSVNIRKKDGDSGDKKKEIKHKHVFLGAFAKLQKATLSFVTSLSVLPSVRPHGSRLPMDGFS
jgi:hypothetical protein